MPSAMFRELIGGQLESVIKKNEDFELRMADKLTNTLNEVRNESSSVRLETLVNIKKLGFGQFGSVYLVKSRETGKYYALKCVSKAQILSQNLEKHLIQEKRVLEMIHHPYVMQFIRTFKDDNYIYFLVEYIKGMELFDAIREIGLLNSEESQFYIGQLVLGMEHLHSNNIIYRDLKPENVMVDSKGFLRMIDMGTAKILKAKTARTFTIIGTPHYMAPEVLTGKGYSLNVDLWSIGVCLFEFMCGMVPFGEEAEDPYEIYEEIIKKDIKYPSFLKDKKAKKFMEQLLSKIPEQRLGSSYASIKANPWFDQLDWDKLMEKDAKVPWIPTREKMISDEEIRRSEALGKLVINEISVACDGSRKVTFTQAEGGPEKKTIKKLQNFDPEWDKEF
eukprot:TRINITY_DN2320_c0_g2_i2.p1 TRINITY_DN2320_c0_g2~~TRINITY_DN2320_c0_g2_i2.p1  ORF type:complete len:391 (-),score=74.98 TRINITY_DN2320_c0_g2_i2:131-1303(-)